MGRKLHLLSFHAVHAGLFWHERKGKALSARALSAHPRVLG